MNTILLLYLVIVVAPISNFIHELGHGIGARIAKADQINLIVGSGKRIIRFVITSFDIQIGLLFFTSGYTISNRDKQYSSFEVMYITFLGPLFNAMFVCIFFLLYQHISTNYILVFMLYNAWLFIVNILPFKINGRESDGYIIFREIWKK